jgi:hypothetical protein
MGFVFAFLGSAVGNLAFAISMGAGLILFILYITVRRYYIENPVIFSMIIFILITAVIASLTRFGFGIEQSVSSRYSIYSILLIACCYMAFVTLFYRKMNAYWLILLTSLAFIFNVVNQCFYIPEIMAEKREFELNYALITDGKPSDFNFGWPTPDHTVNYYGLKYLKASDSLGYFKFSYFENPVLNQ